MAARMPTVESPTTTRPKNGSAQMMSLPPLPKGGSSISDRKTSASVPSARIPVASEKYFLNPEIVLWRYSAALFARASAREHVVEDFVIALVAGVLEQALGAALEPDDRRPRRRPRRRIVDRDCVIDSIGRDGREAFDGMQVIGRAHEVVLRREVGRVDDERPTFPVSSRVALPPAKRGRQVRTPVQIDDARFVHRLEEQHDVRRRLDDLVIAERSRAGVGAAQSWHAVREAALDVNEIFRSVWRQTSLLVSRRPSLQIYVGSWNIDNEL